MALRGNLFLKIFIGFWLATIAILALASQPVPAAPTPRQPLRLADLDCDRAGTVPAIRLDREGRMEVSWRDGRGCVRWSIWVPR